MKKVIMLLLAIGSITAVFAQNRYPDQRGGSRDVILGNPNSDRVYGSNDRRYDNDRYDNRFSARERDQLIRQINKDYDRQIQVVKRSRSIRSYEKNRQIRFLEAQRDQRIREVHERYNRQSSSVYRNRNSRW